MKENNIIVYNGTNGEFSISVRLENETVWLSIEQISELFGKSRSTINEHILNIYKEEELIKDNTMKKIGNSDFSTKPINLYILKLLHSYFLHNSI